MHALGQSSCDSRPQECILRAKSQVALNTALVKPTLPRGLALDAQMNPTAFCGRFGWGGSAGRALPGFQQIKKSNQTSGPQNSAVKMQSFSVPPEEIVLSHQWIAVRTSGQQEGVRVRVGADSGCVATAAVGTESSALKQHQSGGQRCNLLQGGLYAPAGLLYAAAGLSLSLSSLFLCICVYVCACVCVCARTCIHERARHTRTC